MILHRPMHNRVLIENGQKSYFSIRFCFMDKYVGGSPCLHNPFSANSQWNGSSPVLTKAKHPHSMMLLPLCFTTGDGMFRVMRKIAFLENIRFCHKSSLSSAPSSTCSLCPLHGSN